ncbi:Gfo/Idh/MocA family protein [Streptomyces griseosporeus]|uniref:Gfo/Idh/MocA family protein n=1 Tax=Streptomyces griseosporeus TaxID=1910 RepID=UPI0036FCD174
MPSLTDRGKRVGIAFLGCGYAADFYGPTLPNYPEIELLGAYDPASDRTKSFAAEYGGRVFGSMEEVLADPGVEIVVNLTPTTEHYFVNKAALSAGKHVYCEKPMTTSMAQARELAALAAARGLHLCSAPATVFSRSAQTLLRAVHDGAAGTPRLAYASLDMGPLAFMAYRDWRSTRGVPWPYREEVGNGCVLEHAGYLLTWLTAMFGPVVGMSAQTVTPFADQWEGVVDDVAPETSFGALRFADGTVCRLTIGWAAPADKSLLVVGDQGVLSVDDVWQASSPVMLRRRVHTSGRDTGYLAEPEQLPFVLPPLAHGYDDEAHDLTVAAGIADLARAVRSGGRPLLGAEYSLHILDVSLRLAAARSTEEYLDVPAPSATRLWGDRYRQPAETTVPA